MANFFDQFDEQQVATPEMHGGNFFDQFDEQAVQTPQPVRQQAVSTPQGSNLAAGLVAANTQLAQGLNTGAAEGQESHSRVIDAFTGKSRMTPEMEALPAIGEAPELNRLSTDAIRAGIGQLFGSEESQMKILQSMGARLSQDAKGNVIVSLPSGDYALNRPGLSPQDVTSFIANAAAYTPAVRGASILGAAAKSAATDTVLQGGVQAAGGQSVDPKQVALAAALGGGGKALEKGISATARAVQGEIAPEARAAIEFAEQNDVPLLTNDVRPAGTFTGRSAQALGEKIPLTGTGKLRRDQQAARTQLVDDFADRYAPPAPEEIVQSLQRTNSRVKNAAGQRLERINKDMAAVGTLQAAKALASIDQEIAKLGRLGGVADGQTINKLQAYRDELVNGADFEQLRNLRTQFRQDVKGDRVVWPNQSQASVNRVYAALTGDIDDAVKTNLGDKVVGRYRQANAAYANEAQLINNTRLKTILQKGELTPEVANSLLFSAKPSEVRQLYSALDQRGRNAARAAVIGKAYEKAGGSPDRFLGELNRLSKQTGILFKGQERQYVDGLKKYLSQTQRAARAGAVTPTGQELMQIAVPAGLFMGGVKGAAAGLSYGALARAYESKPVRNALLRLANTPAGSTAFDRHSQAVTRALTAALQAEKQ